MEINECSIEIKKKQEEKTPATILATKSSQSKKVTMEGGFKLKRNATYYGKSSVIGTDLKVIKLPPVPVSSEKVPRGQR